MSLADINLNHFASLDALLRERNVRRAAMSMGVTQSAMSHTLRALREMLGDPLLVRVGNEMVLTPLAEGIQAQLRDGLAALESVVSGRAAFDPAVIEDEFTLLTHDGLAAAFGAPLSARLAEVAPRASLHLNVVQGTTLRAELTSGDADLALVAPLYDLTGLTTQPLGGVVKPMIVCRKDHPRVRSRISLETFSELPHAVVSLGERSSASFLDDLLAQRGLRRTIRFRTPSIMALASALVSSDMISVLPRPMGPILAERWPLKMVHSPLTIPAGPVLLCWHPRFDADPPRRFFRELVLRVGAETDRAMGVS